MSKALNWTLIKSLPALAFLPSQSIVNCFENIQDELLENENMINPVTFQKLEELFSYFEDTYIGKIYATYARTNA